MKPRWTKCGCEMHEKAAWRVIRKFVGDVCVKAERNMLKTGKLEGSHYAAMREIFNENGIKFPTTK